MKEIYLYSAIIQPTLAADCRHFGAHRHGEFLPSALVVPAPNVAAANQAKVLHKAWRPAGAPDHSAVEFGINSGCAIQTLSGRRQPPSVEMLLQVI